MVYIGAFLGGVILGGVYFGGLWLTVRRIGITARPGAAMFGSYFLRLTAAALGFYLAVRLGGLPALLTTLGGFLAMRLLMTRKLRPVSEHIRQREG